MKESIISEIKGLRIEEVYQAIRRARPDLPELNAPPHNKIMCPLHKDTEPSMAIGGKYNGAKCFGCGKSLNSFDLIVTLLDTDAAGAIKWAKSALLNGHGADAAPPPSRHIQAPERPPIMDLDKAKKLQPLWAAALQKDEACLEFLQKDYVLYREFIAKAGLGLYRHKEKGPCIIYPVPNPTAPTAFITKTVTRSAKGKRDKWFLSGDSKTYYHTKDLSGRVVWVGGEEKFLLLVQLGFKAVSQLTGENLTRRKLDGDVEPVEIAVEIAKAITEGGATEVVLAGDADPAGHEMNEGARQALRENGFTGDIRFIEWPDGVKKGYDVNDAHKMLLLEQLIEGAVDPEPPTPDPDTPRNEMETVNVDPGYTVEALRAGCWTDKGKIIHAATCQAFATLHPHMWFVENSWFEFRAGFYQEMHDEEALRCVADLLGPSASYQQILEIGKYLKIARFKRREFWNTNAINCANGCIDLNNVDWNNPEIVLEPHHPKQANKHQIAVRYDASAECPTFLKTLNNILPDSGLQFLVQQWFGYCLIPCTRFQVAMVWYGSGSNGKGILSGVLRALLGESQVSHLRMGLLQEKFLLHQLYNVLVNIASESKANSGEIEDVLKQVVHADSPILADVKYYKPFSFISYARWLLCLNTALESSDISFGFWRSFLVVPFEKTFSDSEHPLAPKGSQKPDYKLSEHLTVELPGILNWAIEGLMALMHNGRFIVPQASYDALQDMEMNTNTVRRFHRDHCQNDPQQREKRSFLYRNYRLFCRREGNIPCSCGKFFERLKQIFPAEIGVVKTAGTYYITGIKVTDEIAGDDDED